MDTQTSTPPPAPQTPQPSGPHQQNTGMAVLAYLGILIIVPFLTEAKNDPFVKFHIKQGLVLLILEVISWFIWVIPFFGWILGWALWVFTIVMIVLGIMNAVSGKEKELPIIGNFAEHFHF